MSELNPWARKPCAVCGGKIAKDANATFDWAGGRYLAYHMEHDPRRHVRLALSEAVQAEQAKEE